MYHLGMSLVQLLNAPNIIADAFLLLFFLFFLLLYRWLVHVVTRDHEHPDRV